MVLDVAAEATNVGVGITLHGAGKVWIDDVAVEIVDSSVPTTDRAGRPKNLDFEM